MTRGSPWAPARTSMSRLPPWPRTGRTTSRPGRRGTRPTRPTRTWGPGCRPRPPARARCWTRRASSSRRMRPTSTPPWRGPARATSSPGMAPAAATTDLYNAWVSSAGAVTSGSGFPMTAVVLPLPGRAGRGLQRDQLPRRLDGAGWGQPSGSTAPASRARAARSTCPPWSWHTRQSASGSRRR